MNFSIYPDGSFDLTGERLSLRGCYPAVDGRPLRPTGLKLDAGGVTYLLGAASLTLRFSAEGDAVAVAGEARGLPGVHDVEPLGGGEIQGAGRVYVQGFGMEGPSGGYPLDGSAPASYGLTALYGDTGALLAWAEDHRRYTCVFRTARPGTLAGARETLSGGFNLEGTAGETVTLPALYFAEADTLAAVLARTAERIAAAMGARRGQTPAFFWNSWYHAYETMDHALLEETVAELKRSGLPFQYVELDAGYTPSLGDWLTPNHRWPGGLERAARTVLDGGFQPGIWIGPFMVGSDSALYREHPDWMLRDLDGKPLVQLRSYTEPKLWGNRDGEYYVLDASHPGALAYLKTVFTALRGWGFRFFKTDFMFWNMHDTSTVRRHDPSLTSVEILRRVLSVIRGAIGEDSYLLGCIAPFMPFIGYADGMRIAGDCGARWAEPYGPVNLLRELPWDCYFNHVFWQNDPDAMLLRDFDSFLSDAEAESLALLQALSGGAVNTSDPVWRMSERRRALLRLVVPCGLHTPALPRLGSGTGELVLTHRLDRGELLYVLNPTDRPLTVYCPFGELFGGGERYALRYGAGEPSRKCAAFAGTLAPHESALLFLTDRPLARQPENLWIW